MSNKGSSMSESTRIEIIARSNNHCCICQTPFVVVHHLDGNHGNNLFSNLAPLCPNCHNQAHSKTPLTTSLTPERIGLLRDRWYEYCDRRKEYAGISPYAALKVKNFVRSVGWAQYGWKKTFTAIDPGYRDLTVDEIIDRVFSTTNRDEIITYLETMKYMYQDVLTNESNLEKFRNLCNAFGIDYDTLP